MDAVTHLAPTVGVVAACDFLGVARASFYRQRPVPGPTASPVPEPVLPAARPAPARALSAAERVSVGSVSSSSSSKISPFLHATKDTPTC
jgi:hypothetical protein